MMKILKNSLGISHEIVKSTVQPGDQVIDATAGNGGDTVFLAQLVGEAGHVFSFDIQEAALQSTQIKLEAENLLTRVTLVKDGHQNMNHYVTGPVKVVMFNLGYLPGGDHNIGTKAATTIEAIEKSLNLVVKNGIVMIVIYYGGDSGFEEKEAVLEYLASIDCKKYSVLMHHFINQVNCPPIAVCIEKLV